MNTALRSRLRASVGASSATSRELVAQAGRVLLWLAVLLVLIRGLDGIASARHGASRVRGASGQTAAGGWPDDAARAFAVQFATAYLTHAPGADPVAYARRVDGFASAELADKLAPAFAWRAPAQALQAAIVGGIVRLDGRRALITVAATLTTGGGQATRWLTVPIARDDRGGLVVYDLPSFAAGPARAAGGPVQGDPLFGPDSGAITDVVSRFLRAYLVGDTGALAYLSAPGTRIAATTGGLRLLDVDSIETAAPASAGGRVLLVAVSARDLVSRVTYALRYRVQLVSRDRWYVAAINRPGKGRER
jgi:hypothetical protein